MKKQKNVKPRTSATPKPSEIEDDGDVSESLPLPADERTLRRPLPENTPPYTDLDESDTADITGVQPIDGGANGDSLETDIPLAPSNEGQQPSSQPVASADGARPSDTESLAALIADPIAVARLQITVAEKNIMLMDSIARSLMNMERIFGGIESQLLMLTELQVQLAKGRF